MLNLLHANDTNGAYPHSWYAATATPFPAQPSLRGEVSADVCVIGGGYTGLSAALELAERGFSVVLLEAQRVGFGASGRNGGQVGSGQRLEQDELEKLVGKTRALALWEMGEAAKALVQDRIARHTIPADYRAGIAHACWTAAEVKHAHHYADHLAKHYNYDKITPLDKSALREILPSEAYQGGDIDSGAGHLHPLNYALGLASAALEAGVQIFEGAEVHRIDHGASGQRSTVATPQGKVTCNHVVISANGYLGALEGQVAARVMPINNFIIATEPLGARAAEVLRADIAVADTKFVVNYWRMTPDQRLLFGGGESYGYRFPDIKKTVMKPMLEVYPSLRDVKITHAWGGTLAITMNRMPCLMRPHPNALSASGFSGHGVAMATLAGKMMADAIAGQAERFDLMASLPQARFPGGVALRWPLLVAAMTWYSLRDKLGR
ncbi:NAD(P)/FAD-dependent oxidoreductase [Albirhodobacter sp. R86504]|uniref:NAD(P)/FAD-dependent oxidoreductase n=1 Tax=Albirhodobacter sp. R86504 TaxID=3093848 RepID=UPI0036707A6F